MSQIIIDTHGEYNENIYLVIPEELISEFKEVIKRGTAFGTQTSPEIKVFADRFLGRISYTYTGKQLGYEIDTSCPF